MTARRALLASIFVVLATTSLIAQPKRAGVADDDSQPSAIVLCYHIVEAPADSRMEISRETFRQHLRYLEMTGYNVIPLRHLYEYVSGKRKSIPKNAVVITIDDGWRSTYTEAYPELKKRNFPFTVFIYPNIIGKTSNALTWQQIKEMSDAGVDIQSHSLTHPFLTKRRHRKSQQAYAEWLQRELAESKRILEKQTGKPVRYLAYPYGDYDDVVAEQAGRAGYDAALTCDFGKVKKGSNPLKMRRVVIDKRMSFATVRQYLGATPMQLAEITPAPAQPVDPGVTVISAKIPAFKNLDPKSVGMALLSLGDALPYSYDARNGSISLALRNAISKFQSRDHRAIVWGTDMKTGKRVEASFVLQLPAVKKPAPTPAPAQVPAPATPSPIVAASAMGGGSKK